MLTNKTFIDIKNLELQENNIMINAMIKNWIDSNYTGFLSQLPPITKNNSKWKKSEYERFIEKIKFADNFNDCWEWTGGKMKTGYGGFAITRKNIKYAHRVAFSLWKEEIPDGLLIRHTCHNRSCVSPFHLLTGTDQDNMDDCVAANRQAKGEKNGHAILTEQEVKEIKQKWKPYVYTMPMLANEYDVSVSTIESALNNWRHI